MIIEMQDTLSVDFLILLLATAVTAGTPLLYAALGEIIAERAGILNLGVEGMMLAGAVSGFMVTLASGNCWAGYAAGMGMGGLLALIHAFLTINFKANQMVSGLSLTLFGTGVSSYLGKNMIGQPAPATFETISIPGLSNLPGLGPVFFQHDALVYISYVLVIAAGIFLFYTHAGLNLRAMGENPGAADAMGINVFFWRYVSVFIGGALAGAGGAYLSLAYAPSWVENMTGGRGWIALALVIFSLWNPFRAFWSAYLFGGIDAVGFRLQIMGIVIPSFFLQMLPYIFTILALIFITTRKRGFAASAPKALGLPYHREDH